MLRGLAIVNFVLAATNFAFFVADGHIYSLLAGAFCFVAGYFAWWVDAEYRIRR
jgi:hypothetical protein